MPIETIYHKNGKIREQRPIENGIINGVVKRYSEIGFLASEIPYVNGLINGVKKRYFSDGTIKAEIPYVDGLIHGSKRRFNKHGLLFESIRYDHGEYVKTSFYDTYFASGLTEEERLNEIRRDKIRKAANSVFLQEPESYMASNVTSQCFNPSKIITDDVPDSVGEVLERPRTKRIVDPQVESFTHPEENGRLLNERIDRGVIVGNSNFTSETVTSFEITYFKGINQESTASQSKRSFKENPITVWIEKGDGIEFKTRVWIRNGKWFGRFITSKNVSWEHYMWILFQKFNVLEWKSDVGIDVNPGEYGSIRIYSQESEITFSWVRQRPEKWDEFLTFFNRFFGKNTRTSFEEGLFLTNEQESFLDNGGTIKDFCQAKFNLQNLQKPDDIFYPKDTMPCKCPCCGSETNYKDYRDLSKRFCYKCYKKVCEKFPLPDGVDLADAVSFVKIEFATDHFFLESTTGIVLTISKNKQIRLKYAHLEQGVLEKNSYIISKDDWQEFLETLFNKAFCHEWAQSYEKHLSHMYDGNCDNWGFLKVRFKNFHLGYKKILTNWSGKEPPYWAVAFDGMQKLIKKLSLLKE